LVLITALISVSKIGPASAQVDNAQRAKEIEAKKSCLAGGSSYKAGIEILAELYATTNEPTYIYNQGRCYQQNNQPELALSRFQEYLRKEPKMTSKEKVTLEKNMDECKDQLEKTQPTPATPRPIKIELPNESIPTETEVSAVPEPAATSSRGFRVAGVTLTTVGLVSLGAAATMNWLYLKNRPKDGDFYDKNDQSKSNMYKLFAILGYGVGAASIVTGITLYLLDSRSEKTDEPNLAFIPSILPSEATLSLRGTF
jgi:hypothetical protein